MTVIHSTAIIDPGARIGADVTIGPFCIVEHDTVIGDGCQLAARASILAYTELGPGVKVHTNAVVGDLPQDLAFQADTISYVRVGARTVIREGVTIHRGTKPGSETVIGSDCLFMGYSHAAHNVRTGNGVILVNNCLLAGYVEVGDKVFLSGNCAVHQFCRLGRLGMMSGLSALSKDLPPFCVAENTETNRVSGLNVVGMRRAGMNPETRNAVKQAFKLLYLSGLNTRQALEKMAPLRAACPEVEEFAAFVESSKRGICAYGGDVDAEKDAPEAV
jgi:UDP-N-acetylglucosamine acyltransferase